MNAGDGGGGREGWLPRTNNEAMLAGKNLQVFIWLQQTVFLRLLEKNKLQNLERLQRFTVYPHSW
jgi:hypothetical protein